VASLAEVPDLLLGTSPPARPGNLV
jgi:hypothetical protein